MKKRLKTDLMKQQMRVKMWERGATESMGGSLLTVYYVRLEEIGEGQMAMANGNVKASFQSLPVY